MKITVEDVLAEDGDRVPLLVGGTKHGGSQDCAYSEQARPLKDSRARTKLVVACIICVLFMVAEIVGGILSNSLAILTDSAHLFSDLSSFVVGLVAMFLSGKPSSKTMTFGWHRAEVIGALFSVLLIWVLTGVLVYTAILRIITDDFHINSQVMLIMSGVAVFINIIMAFVLHPHSHTHEHNHSHSSSMEVDSSSSSSYQPLLSPVSDSINSNGVKQRGMRAKVQNINLRAAFIHVIGDIVQSIGVLVASIIIYYKPQWKIADPICTFVFSLLVVFTTISIFHDILCILLERKPRHLSYDVIDQSLSGIPGVFEVHSLRLWSITLSITAVTCHLKIFDKGVSKEVLDKAYGILSQDFHISEITIQIETQDSGDS